MSRIAWPGRVCAECGYELIGLPTRTCPECGCDTVEAERRRLRRRRAWQVSRHWLLVPAGAAYVLVVMLADPYLTYRAQELGLVLLCCFVPILWRWLALGCRGHGWINYWSLLIGAPAVTMITAWLVQAEATIHVEYFVVFHLVSLVAVLIGWFFVPQARLWSVLCSAGLVWSLGAFTAVLHAGWCLSRGQAWSGFGVSISNPQPAVFPMLARDLLWRSIPFLTVGVSVVTASLLIRERGRRPSDRRAPGPDRLGVAGAAGVTSSLPCSLTSSATAPPP